MTQKMKTLAAIFSEHQGKLSDKWSIYISEYERLFKPYQSRAIRLLEIGIQNGGSLEIWAKYFSKGKKLIGCDINPDCKLLSFDDPRIALVVMDANTDDAEHKIVSYTPEFDLIIDDGSHRSSDIVATFSRYFPYLKIGGLFIAEDLHCSYWQDFEGGLFRPYSSMAFFKQLADVINHEHWGISKTRAELINGFNKEYGIELDEENLSYIHSVEFINSMCVIRKAEPNANILGTRYISGPDAKVWDGALLLLHGSTPTKPDQQMNIWAQPQVTIADELALRLHDIAQLKRDITGMENRIEAYKTESKNSQIEHEEIKQQLQMQIAAQLQRETLHNEQLSKLQAQLNNEKLVLEQKNHEQILQLQREQAESEWLSSERNSALDERLQIIQNKLIEREKEFTIRENDYFNQLNENKAQIEFLLSDKVKGGEEFARQLTKLQERSEQNKNQTEERHSYELNELRRKYAEHEWLTNERIHVLQERLHAATADMQNREWEYSEREKHFQSQLFSLYSDHENALNRIITQENEHSQIIQDLLNTAQKERSNLIHKHENEKNTLLSQQRHLEQFKDEHIANLEKNIKELHQINDENKNKLQEEIRNIYIENSIKEKTYNTAINSLYAQNTEKYIEFSEKNDYLKSKANNEIAKITELLHQERVKHQEINANHINQILNQEKTQRKIEKDKEDLVRNIQTKMDVLESELEERKLLLNEYTKKTEAASKYIMNEIDTINITTNNSQQSRYTKIFNSLKPFNKNKEYKITSAHNRIRAKAESIINSTNNANEIIFINRKYQEATQATTQSNVDITINSNKEHSTMKMNKDNAAGNLNELMLKNGQSFIINAYRAILKREPDPDGMSYYLARLRSGTSKIQILYQISRSKEASNTEINMPGLKKLILNYKRVNTPLIGPLLKLFYNKNQQSVEKNLRILDEKIHLIGNQIQILVSRNDNNEHKFCDDKDNLNTDPIKKSCTNEIVENENLFDEGLSDYNPIRDRVINKLKKIKNRFEPENCGLKSIIDNIKISILMPVYKVKPELLISAIESVRRQSYLNWELCIVDDGSDDVTIKKILENYSENDNRIKIQLNKTNHGISSATNDALDLATGEFVGLLDNDDILTFDALEEVFAAIKNNPSTDYIYSDECKIDDNGLPIEIFSKPDWSPSALINCMYTGHFSIYRKKLIYDIGKFRSKYDFSQDYDLALRASSQANNIIHISKVLYGWRMTEGSGAQGDKPYARISNIAALQDFADNKRILAKAEPEPYGNHLRILKSQNHEKVSIIIPSDNFTNISNTIDTIIENTLYENYEIIIVTNSKIAAKLQPIKSYDQIRIAKYDLPFNFSDKCNYGAKMATGEIIVFFNDDVRVVSKDWLEIIIEAFITTGAGIVGPKLLYENYLIQHAGMVTGVRGLVGTAFHCLPHETQAHFNTALWLREVSLICGACLAVKKDIFNEIGGFDAINAPIAHSDVDLCFKVREKGYTCVYTPHATLIHIGHMSIGETEAKEAKESAKTKIDKSDIYLLKRWGEYISYDPYFTPEMRDILYHDSPEEINIYSHTKPTNSKGKDILLISHDLSGSGAPRVIYEMAKTLKDSGHFVVVISPTDGPYRKELNKLDVPVIVDELALRQHESFYRFAKNFDLAIANTVVTWPAVKQLGGVIPTYWYIHEISLLEHLFNIQPEISQAFSFAKKIWVGSELAGKLVMPLRPDTLVLKYGVEPVLSEFIKYTKPTLPLKISLFGSYEPRKGQDLALLAIKELPEEYRSKIRLTMHGRILDRDFYEGLTLLADDINEVNLQEELTYDEYTSKLINSDAVLVSSRDDTLPFVSIDALGASKILICTNTTGTSAYITDGKSGFVSLSPAPSDIAASIKNYIDNFIHHESLSTSSKIVFEENFSVNAFTNSLLDACDLNQKPKHEFL